MEGPPVSQPRIHLIARRPPAKLLTAPHTHRTAQVLCIQLAQALGPWISEPLDPLGSNIMPYVLTFLTWKMIPEYD